MNRYSYKDAKLLGQSYKTNLEQLYESPSQERAERIINILTVAASTMEVPGFAEELNTSGDFLMTASLEIFRVKCGMYKEYTGDRLGNAIDLLLLLFTKKLKNYTRKVKETKLDIDLIDFYKTAFTSEELFLLYITYFKILLPDYHSHIAQMSKVQPVWSDLISNMVNSLKRFEDERVVAKCITVATQICQQNNIFCKEFVKNGILPYLLNFVEKCEHRWLVEKAVELIALLTQDKQVAQLLKQQDPEEVFVQLLQKFQSDGLMNKVRKVMDNLIQYGEAPEIEKVLSEAKSETKAFTESRSQLDKIIRPLEFLKLYSLSKNFAKYLARSEAHNWLTPLLLRQDSESVHQTVLNIINSMLANKEFFKNPEDIFNSISKPLMDNLKNPKSSFYLEQYLKVLSTAVKKDVVSKEYSKKNNLIENLQRLSKEDHPAALLKNIREVLTLLELKEGKIMSLPLDVNRKNKDIRELENVNKYLDNVLSMGIYTQVKRDQIETLSDFMGVNESDYPNEDEEQVQALAQSVYKKILKLLSEVFSDLKAIEAMSTTRLLNQLISALPASPDLRQSLDLIEIILVSNPKIPFDKENCIEMLLLIHRSNALNEHVVSSCGEILYFLDAHQRLGKSLKDFDKQNKNVKYLEKLALYMCTQSEDVQDNDIKGMEEVLNSIEILNFNELSQELALNYLIVLTRMANMSDVYRNKIRAKTQMIGAIQNCFQKSNLKPFVLEFFSSLIGKDPNLHFVGQPPPKDISQIESNVQRLTNKVLEDNSYSIPELRFLEKMSDFGPELIVNKVKLKGAQTIALAGHLFATIASGNKLEGKKAQGYIEQLNQQFHLKNKNLLQILRFFSELKDEDHYADQKKLESLIRQLSAMDLDSFQLYPVRYKILRLVLDCLAQTLSKTKQMRDTTHLQSYMSKLLKTLHEPKQAAICDSKVVQGSENVKDQALESVFTCLKSIAGVDNVRVKPNDIVIKCAQGSCNPYIMSQTVRLLNKVVQDEGCKESKIKLKECVSKKYPYVKDLIDFDAKQQQINDKAQNQADQKEAADAMKGSASSSVGSTAANPVKAPSRPQKTVIQSIIPQNAPKKEADMSQLSPQEAKLKIHELLNKKQKQALPPADFLLSRAVDALREDRSEQADQILAQLYFKYIKIVNKLCPQDVEALNRITIRIQQTRRTTEYVIEMLETTVQVVEVTEKIKLLGERALMYAIKIFKDQPAFASKIIQYNLISDRQFGIIENHKIPQQVIEVLSKSLKDAELDKYICLLIGTSAKSKTIQQIYAKSSTDKYLFEILRNNQKDPKIVANCFYALAGITFCLEEMSMLITTEANIKTILELMKINQQSNTVVESGSCLISNLCYRNDGAKKIFFQCNVIDNILELFKNQLEAKEYKGNTFKQMLRVLGNCSLLVDNSKRMVSKDFIPLSISLIELVNCHQDLEVLKYVIEVYSNLSSHTDADFKPFLTTIFKQGSLDMLLTLLETQLLNPEIIAACIDSIDGLSQDKQIERYAVSKRLLPLLLDILKSHEWNEKIVVKAIRVISNLTLDKDFIVKILEANVPSILANILSNRKLERNKLGLYRMKIITRIYNAKVKTDLIMKSGYLDCILESLRKQTQLYSEHLDILIYYAKDMSEFMNKKTFQTVVPVLEKNLNNEAVSNKCLILLKLIDRDADVEQVIAPLSRIFVSLTTLEKGISTGDRVRVQDLLNLLIGYCSRCPNLKAVLRERNFVDSLQVWRGKVLDDQDFLNETIGICTMVILNEYIPKQVAGVSKEESQEFLLKGLHCKMYRRDSTFKRAMVSMSPEFELRGYKFPDGEVKQKYKMHILNVKDACFKFQSGTRMWELSVFSKSGGLFDKKADSKLCCTIIGPVTKAGAVMLNLEFETEGMKNCLEQHLFNLIKQLREK